MRNFIDIMENASDPILAAINVAVDAFGQDALFGGNCGMFALALAEHMKKQSIDIQISIVCRDDFDDDADVSAEDIIAAETDIYHVVVRADGAIYDGEGRVTIDHVADWVYDQYKDDQAVLFNFDLSEPALKSLIDNDTAWSIPMSEFLHCWEGSQ